MSKIRTNNRLIFHHFLTFCGALIIFNACTTSKINKFKNGQQTGLWISYKDSTRTTFLNKGKFKDGVQVGKWIYNSPDGLKERIEVYRGKKIKIKHFHPNGKIAVKGKGRIVVEEKKLHFYYYGPWYFYLDNGQLQKTAWFENGLKVKEVYKIKTGNEAYDSLNVELIALDKDFVKYRDTLKITLEKFGKNSAEYIFLKQLAHQNDSLIYLRIEKIVKRFGFPEKLYTGEKNEVIFFIIGFAPWQIKEKYLEIFRAAAERNEINLGAFTYFEDKYWLAKEGYQIYGTQYKYDKNYKEIYYPVKDVSGMNDRRKKMGLEGVNLLNYPEHK
ncbi:MAG TPA: hypothetical protein VN026_16835 [Bacteroidia bacterium]|nr:hypothetical protein [Bacteroidia bacterium]